MSAGELVLGIDPGTHRCGFGLVARQGSRFVHHGHGVARAALHASLPERLLTIADVIDEVIRTQRPSVMAIEKAFFHRDANAALMIGHARGVAMLLGARHGLYVGEYSPATIKRAVVGSGKADKDQVCRMVQAVLGLANQPAPDAADALAIAICHASALPRKMLEAQANARSRA